MCGRFALHSPLATLLEQFEASAAGVAWEPRYNVAPTQPVAAVRVEAGERRVARLRWGLVPRWAREVGEGPLLINARAESAASKPAFREALRRRRCLVPADGFYEWERSGRARLPLLFSAPDGAPLAMAGIWERWSRPGAAPVESCAVLTTAASGVVAPLHDRMPALIPRAAFERWLDPGLRDPQAIADLLAPPPDAALRALPLEPWVNDVRHEGPRCLTERLTLFGG